MAATADAPCRRRRIAGGCRARPEPELETEAEEEAAPPLPPILHLTDADFARAAAALNCHEAAVRAVAEIEAAGGGFSPDGPAADPLRGPHLPPPDLGRLAAARDRRGVRLSVPNWDRTLYGRAGAAQHERLAEAAALDWEAAHRACSWGLFQILGTNHAAVGHPTIAGFVEAMVAGAGPHLDAFVAFVQTNRLDGHLRQRNWGGLRPWLQRAGVCGQPIRHQARRRL